MSIINKIKNPNAGSPQIFLAILYIAVIGSLTAYAFYWHFCLRSADVGLIEKINF